jgi:hypothetical protein
MKRLAPDVVARAISAAIVWSTSLTVSLQWPWTTRMSKRIYANKVADKMLRPR